MAEVKSCPDCNGTGLKSHDELCPTCGGTPVKEVHKERKPRNDALRISSGWIVDTKSSKRGRPVKVKLSK